MDHKNALLVFSLLASSMALAQTETGVEQPSAPAGCSSEQHRQFDFWVGHWDVTSGGQPAGGNHIERVSNGCALAEHWTSATPGFTGSSLKMLDRTSGQWHQTWVDSSGLLLQLDGGLVDGEMILSGELPGPDGGTVTHRITWTPNADGSVRQHWETSPDGQEWTTAFDGLYVRSNSPQ
jgi:hypothetical protein